MNIETEEFIKDLKALCSKHDIMLDESDEYNGVDEYCGTSYTFMGKKDDEGTYKIYLDMVDVAKYI